MIHKAIRQARDRHERAAKALAAATARAYPIDTLIEVTLGRARIRARVTAAGGDWWHETDYVYVVNLDTGKPRKFCASLEDHNVLVLCHLDATRVCRTCEGEYTPRISNAHFREFWCSADCEDTQEPS